MRCKEGLGGFELIVEKVPYTGNVWAFWDRLTLDLRLTF